MNRFYAPENSVTEQSVRMAHNYEYMVPIETAWELEQQLNRALAKCDRLRKVRRKLRQAEKDCAKYFKETLALRPLPEAAQ